MTKPNETAAVELEPTTVWKFTLPYPSDWVEVQMPEGAEPLFVGEQFDVPCLWARVNPDALLIGHHFRWCGTGHPLDERVGQHVGSWQTLGGNLVWHLFAEARP